MEHDEVNNRFLIRLSEDDIGVIEYQKQKGKVLVMYHTGVPEKYRGQGIAEKLAIYAFTWAKENGYKVVPQCSYLEKFVKTKGSSFLDISIVE